MKRLYHEHPIRIIKYSVKNIWLLIFPLLRGLNAIRLDRDRMYEWLRGAWFDILILVLIVIFGFLRWICSVVEISPYGITHTDGIVFRLKKTLPYSNLSSTSFEYPFYLRPFRAVAVRCDTSAGIFRVSDMKILVSYRVGEELHGLLPGIKDFDRAKKIPKPSLISIVLLSMFFSSGFTGTVYLATFFFKGGDIASDLIGSYLESITSRTAMFSRRFLKSIPDAALGIGAFFVAAWFLSFMVNLMKYARFSLIFDKRFARISYGALTKKEYSISRSHVNYIDLRQNLIMKLIRATSVNVSCAGYGNTRKRLPILVPVKREDRTGRLFEKLGIRKTDKPEHKPPLTGFWQYVWLPVIVSVSLIPAYLIAARFVPEIHRLTIFFAIMAEIPVVWLIFVKTADFFTSGITIYDDRIRLSYSRLTMFHTIIAERGKIVKAEIEQSVFQRLGKRCSLCFWFEGESKHRHKVRALRVSSAREILDILGTDIRDRV